MLTKITFLCFLLAIIACTNSSNNVQDVTKQVVEKYNDNLLKDLALIKQAKEVIQSGDLICRTGYDFESQSLQSFNLKDKTYSHSGLAFWENGEVMVYHAIAGQDENPDETFKREPLDSFINPTKKKCFGVFRYSMDSTAINCLHNTFKELEKQKIKFDKQFNLQDDDKQYCSEAIAKGLKKCTSNKIIIPTTIKYIKKIKVAGYQHLQGKNFEYYALDNLYLNTYCKEILKTTYNTGYAKPIR